MVYQLDDELWFPDPHYGDDDGCIAVGGDLSVDRLLLAYSNGIFPWYPYYYDEAVWYCPMQRFVIFPEEIHVSHSMRTLMNKDRYRMSINEDFEGVINNCSELRIEENGAWLGPAMIEAYTELHRQGFAASVEVWEKPGEGRRALWCHHWQGILWREHVLAGAQCLKAGTYPPGANHEKNWRSDNRLPVSHASSGINGWALYFLRRVYADYFFFVVVVDFFVVVAAFVVVVVAGL